MKNIICMPETFSEMRWKWGNITYVKPDIMNKLCKHISKFLLYKIFTFSSTPINIECATNKKNLHEFCKDR